MLYSIINLHTDLCSIHLSSRKKRHNFNCYRFSVYFNILAASCMKCFAKTDHIQQTVGVWIHGRVPGLPISVYFVRKSSYNKNKEPHFVCLVFWVFFPFSFWNLTNYSVVLWVWNATLPSSSLTVPSQNAWMHLLLPTCNPIIFFFNQQKEAFVGKPSIFWAVCDSKRKSVAVACNGSPVVCFQSFFSWPLSGRAIRAQMYRENLSQSSNQSKHYIDFDCSNKNEVFVNWSSFIDSNEEMYLFCFVKCSKLCVHLMLMNSEMKDWKSSMSNYRRGAVSFLEYLF